MKKTIILGIVTMSVMTACTSNESIQEKDGEIVSRLAAKDQSPEEIQREQERIKKMKAIEESNKTTLSFDKLTHDFGDVQPDSDNTTQFTITNTGDKPLIVENVSASCGCTTPVKPSGPIAPGMSDFIEVTFHPKPNQKNEIKKTVTVTANTKEKIHQLEIRAFVK